MEKNMLDKEKSLEFLRPEIAIEWHSTKNGKLTAKDVSCGSGKKVWWKCTEDHEWETSVNNRNRGRGCPICAINNRGEQRLENRIARNGSLADNNPTLAKE